MLVCYLNNSYENLKGLRKMSEKILLELILMSMRSLSSSKQVSTTDLQRLRILKKNESILRYEK